MDKSGCVLLRITPASNRHFPNMAVSDSCLLRRHGIHDRKSFLRWALINHPDKGGNLAIYQEVQSEYSRVTAAPIPRAPQPASKATQPTVSRSTAGFRFDFSNFATTNTNVHHVFTAFFGHNSNIRPHAVSCKADGLTCWRPVYGATTLCDLHQPGQPSAAELANIYGHGIFGPTGCMVCPPYSPRCCEKILKNKRRCRNMKHLSTLHCRRHQ
jgi:hypothetical protein